MPEISKIILYDEPTVPEIQLDELKRFITDTFSIKVESRGSFFQIINKTDNRDGILKEISGTRILDLKKQFQMQPAQACTDTQMEIFDRNAPNNSETVVERDENAMTALYDGFELQKTITKALPRDEDTVDILHVIITDKLVCTFDDEDWRYHARALIGANPTIVSTGGIVEAPAKPKQYYIDMISCQSKEKMQEINAKYQGEFLEQHDSRLGDIIKGYILQAIVYYHYAEEVFCKDKECRLFNAHWQKDLLDSQITNKKFCKKHSDMVKKLKDGYTANSTKDK